MITGLAIMQCLGLSEDDLAQREVDHVDIVLEEVAEKHYKPEEVNIYGICCLFTSISVTCSLQALILVFTNCN